MTPGHLAAAQTYRVSTTVDDRRWIIATLSLDGDGIGSLHRLIEYSVEYTSSEKHTIEARDIGM